MKLGEFELNKIYCMDCLEGLKKIPDNSVDLIVTDPPYGLDITKTGFIGGENLAKVRDYGISNWDLKIPSDEIFHHMFRVSENQVIFGGNYFLDFLGKTKCIVTWDKGRRGLNFADCEIIWTSFNKPSRIINHIWDGMRQENMSRKEKRYHPTQKPVPVMRRLIEWFSEEKNIILDPFMGSGTTAVACKQLNRNFLGFEINQKYVDIANRRLEQGTLHTLTNQKKLKEGSS